MNQYQSSLLFIKKLLPLESGLQKILIALKDIIQFSEFDEENLPKFEEEKNGLIKTIEQIKELVENESKIYRSYRSQLDSEDKKTRDAQCG